MDLFEEVFGALFSINAALQSLEDEREFYSKYNSNTCDGQFGRDKDTTKLFEEAARQIVKHHKQIIKPMRTSEVQQVYGEKVSKRYADKIIDGSASRYTLLLELLGCPENNSIYIELKDIVEFLSKNIACDYYEFNNLSSSNITHVKLH